MTGRLGARLALCLVGAATLAAPARGGFILVTDRSALGATDSLDWGKLGAPYTTVSSPISTTTTGGASTTVAMTGTAFQRRDQGNGWTGNFSPGDAVLWNQGGGPVTLTFKGAGVYAGGAQIQSDTYGAFTAQIEALDSKGNVLASFTRSGTGTNANDGSAIFLGIRSTDTPIAEFRFSLTSAVTNPGDFAINRFDLSTKQAPEPSSLLLAGMGALGGLTLLRRRWRRPASTGAEGA